MSATTNCGRIITLPFLEGTIPPLDNVHTKGCLDLEQYVAQSVPERPDNWITAADTWSDRVVNGQTGASGDPAEVPGRPARPVRDHARSTVSAGSRRCAASASPVRRPSADTQAHPAGRRWRRLAAAAAAAVAAAAGRRRETADPQRRAARITFVSSSVLTLILAGGEGERLSILSQVRAKPGVPFGGKYRIIDFALSNAVNSGLTDVGILTQYAPRSLIDHIGVGRPWDLDRSRGGVAPAAAIHRSWAGARLVPRDRGRRPPEPRLHRRSGSGARPDPGRGPRLQDGLPPVPGDASGQGRGRHLRRADGADRRGASVRDPRRRP